MNNKLKRFVLIIIMTLSTLLLSACDLSRFNIFKKTTTTRGHYTISRSTLDNFVYEDPYTYQDVYKMISNGGSAYMPSVGDVKVLVIPIDFSDINTTQEKKDKYVKDINRTFFGDDTGFESLSSYYYKSSYGKLNITGDVTSWYTPKNTAAYYQEIYDDPSKNINQYLGELVNEAVSYFDPYYDFSEYDSDKDGVIDAVYLVCDYTSPRYGSLFWAWQSYYTGRAKHDGKNLYQYMWANVGFMYQDDYKRPIKGDYVNAITFIHETGHLLGADDYYDYSPNVYEERFFKKVKKSEGEGCNYGIGAYDMMDSNCIDHNAVTKMFYGWTTPYVVVQDTTIDLNKFSKAGDTIIVAPSYNSETGNLSEYFVIEYFDYEGLNTKNMFDDRGYTTSGIMIYHVNANVISDGNYWSIFEYDNSYTEHAFLELISAENNKKGECDFIDSSFTATNAVMFQEYDVFKPIYSTEYQDKNLLGVTISILSIGETAKIQISFNS